MSPAPFGTHDPGRIAHLARRIANATPPGLLGRPLRSAMLRVAGGKKGGVHDVIVFDGQRVRLHPSDNLSEKRVYRADAW